MAASVKFCPECGANMENNVICGNCGFDTSKSVSKPAESKSPISSSPKESSYWKTFEPIIADIVGKYAWIIILIAPILVLIYSVILIEVFGGYIAGGLAWIIIQAIAVILFDLFWVKPKFSDRCASRQWDALLDDTLKISSIQIPWMLIVGIIVEIFGTGWIGLFILVPALIIIFLGPRTPYNWNV